jgi:hypothetical protein
MGDKASGKCHVFGDSFEADMHHFSQSAVLSSAFLNLCRLAQYIHRATLNSKRYRGIRLMTFPHYLFSPPF